MLTPIMTDLIAIYIAGEHTFYCTTSVVSIEHIKSGSYISLYISILHSVIYDFYCQNTQSMKL